MNAKYKNISAAAILFSLLLGVTCTGAFAISLERQQMREISRKIISHEKAIEQLRRDNEELSVKIAEQENPALLTKRASAHMKRPQMTAVVWAYENYEGGRVDFTQKSKGLVSFKEPAKNNDRVAEQ